jgi:tetratricopeptide (TPR) repeat protein
MKKIFIPILAALAAFSLPAQEAKQPKPKSQKEVDALQKMFQAPDAETRIKAADELLLKFADTEFKAVALQVAAASAQELNDFERMTIYCERTLEADPKNYAAMLMLASGIAQRTREHDLDKEDKLTRAEKFANDAVAAVKAAAKPRPDITDEQWEGARKDFLAQAHESLGIAAMVRKKYDVAVANFKTAIETGPTPDQATQVRLASALNFSSQFDEAITVLDKLLADANLNPTIRQFASQEKLKAATGKAQKK